MLYLPFVIRRPFAWAECPTLEFSLLKFIPPVSLKANEHSYEACPVPENGKRRTSPEAPIMPYEAISVIKQSVISDGITNIVCSSQR